MSNNTAKPKPKSYHLFMYLFSAAEERKVAEKREITQNWIPADYDKANSDYSLYNYLLPKARNLLFPDVGNNISLKYYKYNLKQENSYAYEIEYSVKTESNTIIPAEKISLSVKDISLLYDEKLCVGILSFYLQNSFDDLKIIKIINDYGRRVYSPIKDHSALITADRLSIRNCDTNETLMELNLQNGVDIEENKNCQKTKNISSLIGFSTEPFMDDRMFTMCAIVDNKLSRQVNSLNFNFYDCSDLVKNIYEIIFVDRDGNCSCQDYFMRADLLKKHSYTRWKNYGTLYGLTEYSMTCITAEGSFTPYTIDSFLYEYSELVRIVLFQRAIATKLGSEIDNARKEDDKNRLLYKPDTIYEMYAKYIYFQNNYVMTDATYQDQGEDIYRMLKDFLNVDQIMALLDQEMHNVQAWSTFNENQQREKAEKKQNDVFTALTIIGASYTAAQIAITVVNISRQPDGIKIIDYSLVEILLVIALIICFCLFKLLRIRKMDSREMAIFIGLVILMIASCIGAGLFAINNRYVSDSFLLFIIILVIIVFLAANNKVQ